VFYAMLSKENIQHFKTLNFIIFLLFWGKFWVIFALRDLDPDFEYGSGSTDRIESGSDPCHDVCRRQQETSISFN
jgi:hypothetical protein